MKYETVLHSSSSSRVEFMLCQLLVLYTQIYCVYDCMCKFFSFQCHDRTCHPNLLLTKWCKRMYITRVLDILVTVCALCRWTVNAANFQYLTSVSNLEKQ